MRSQRSRQKVGSSTPATATGKERNRLSTFRQRLSRAGERMRRLPHYKVKATPPPHGEPINRQKPRLPWPVAPPTRPPTYAA